MVTCIKLAAVSNLIIFELNMAEQYNSVWITTLQKLTLEFPAIADNLIDF